MIKIIESKVIDTFIDKAKTGNIVFDIYDTETIKQDLLSLVPKGSSNVESAIEYDPKYIPSLYNYTTDDKGNKLENEFTITVNFTNWKLSKNNSLDENSIKNKWEKLGYPKNSISIGSKYVEKNGVACKVYHFLMHNIIYNSTESTYKPKR